MINYKHLHYFLLVAKEGSIARASKRLHLTPQTISGQLSLLEQQLGQALFNRVGRRLELTETGRLVLSYAEEIFSLGGELEEVVRGLPETRPLLFKVGVTEVVPKIIAHHLLAPALQLPGPLRIVCREGSIDTLLTELALHRVDLVLADTPMPSGINVTGFNHHLGDCGITFFAGRKLAARLGGAFPQCMSGMPMLLPGETTVVRNRLLKWFDQQRIHPYVAGEFDDSALMKVFGQAGVGAFPVPSVIADEVAQQYGVQTIGTAGDLTERFYAISIERRVRHPAVSAICAAARSELFV